MTAATRICQLISRSPDSSSSLHLSGSPGVCPRYESKETATTLGSNLSWYILIPIYIYLMYQHTAVDYDYLYIVRGCADAADAAAIRIPYI